ncbi:MAG TPA: ATP12 family protein [Beijerinckiaceae bacterium]
MTKKTVRDWFPDPEQERADPMRAAQQAMRPPLPKRFYETANVAEVEGRYALRLDGRSARTPGRRPFVLPTRALGEAVAAEWKAPSEVVDPARMPLTRLANSAIDAVADDPSAVVEDLVRYAGSDLVCYRAGDPERLVEAQSRAWDPVLTWARDDLGARFTLSQGIVFVTQPETAIAAVRRAVEAVQDPFRLAALHVMTTLTGSVLLALATARAVLTPEAAWAAAHADEIYQEGVWGEDAEAAERRRLRQGDFEAAARMFALARAPA